MYNLGSSYYPEQWKRHRWEDDFRKMQDLGFNCVRMGEFAWSTFEPTEGRLEFGWMDDAMELAARYQIRTILCTPTAAAPPWLRQKDRAILGGNERGPYDYGARKGWCLHCQTYTDASFKIVTAMAEHFGANRNIMAWQLDNEPGYPFVCYDPNCLRGFQQWLKARYGSLERLNEAWGNAFWSHGFTEWSQIEFPLNRGDGAWNPGEKLDYRRFFSDNFMRFLRRQTELMRPHTGTTPIWTNWPNTAWSVDIFETASFLDATTWDNYNVAPATTDPRDQYGSARHHDLCRGAGPGQRFLVSEQTAQVPSHARPEGVRLQTHLDLAHGSSGTIYFEWRPPLGGAEQGYVSVLQMDGSFGPAEAQHRRVSEELKRLAPLLADATTESDVAMIYCYDNQWFQGFWSGPEGYDEESERFYKGLKSLARNIDVIPPHRDLSRYRLVAAPGLQIVSDELPAHLRHYVENGGILVLNARAGTRNLENQIREELAPGPFAEIAGIRIPSVSMKHSLTGNLILGPANQITGETFEIRFDGLAKGFAPFTVMEEIQLHGAEPVATFQGAQLTGHPAVTVNRFGRGHVVYVGADSRDVEFYVQLAAFLRRRFAIEPLLEVPFGVSVVSRQTKGALYLFVLNLTDQPRTITLPSPKRDLNTGALLKGTVELAPLDVWVLTDPA